MRHRDSLVKELGISEQVAASLTYKSAPYPPHRVTSLLPCPCPDNEPESDYGSKTHSRLSDSSSPPRRLAVPLSADIHNYRSTKPYDESFCRTEPGYYGMNLQRSSSSQAISRTSRMNPRNESTLRTMQMPTTKPRLTYCLPPHPHSTTFHKLLSTYGHGLKSKVTGTSKRLTRAKYVISSFHWHYINLSGFPPVNLFCPDFQQINLLRAPAASVWLHCNWFWYRSCGCWSVCIIHSYSPGMPRGHSTSWQDLDSEHVPLPHN